MTTQAARTCEEIIARNLAAVYTDDIGWEVPTRGLHSVQCRDGKICRENGYEIRRDISDTTRVRDEIPDTATVEVFG